MSFSGDKYADSIIKSVSFAPFLRRAFITLLEEQLEGADDSCYQKAQNSFDRIVNRFYKNTKNLSISSDQEIDSLLNDKSLLSLIL